MGGSISEAILGNAYNIIDGILGIGQMLTFILLRSHIRRFLIVTSQ